MCVCIMCMYQPKYIDNNQIVNEINVRTINYCNSNTGSYYNIIIIFISQPYNFCTGH